MGTQARNAKLDEVREACLSSLYTFAYTIEPHRVWGDIHKELFNWWQDNNDNDDGLDNLLTLLPRDHQKSHCMAVLAAWLITRDPSITILYISATARLAELQLSDIKNILDSPLYRTLWPMMTLPEEGKRDTWNNSEIVVDHPARKKEGVRDPTVTATGLTSTNTGAHCVVMMKDDVVVPENAYTSEGRGKVSAGCSQLASILTTGGKEFVVGTRYHPNDHYQDLKDMKEEVYNDDGDVTDEQIVYGIFERVVETDGNFLWPRTFRDPDDIEKRKAFGFNWKELARKKAKYVDRTQFFAQYYNNPNDMENQRISRDKFLYYEQKKLTELMGVWHIGGRRLNVYAGMDFAFSLNKKADSTCIVVVGVDYDFNIYVLDIYRFKTNTTETYFSNLLSAQSKWGFRNLRAEVTAAQDVIVQYLKDRSKSEGMVLNIDSHRPNKYQGAKAERIAAALEPRYQNGQVFHYKGGYCGMLEEELMLENPPHDDIKDTLAIVISGEIRKPMRKSGETDNVSNITYHPRFGGVAF